MLVVSRFDDAPGDMLERGETALGALAGRPGFVRGSLGRAADNPGSWVLVTEWEGVGAYRRALSSYEVKVSAAPLLGESREEPSAFEVLLAHDGSALCRQGSDRAEDGGR